MKLKIAWCTAALGLTWSTISGCGTLPPAVAGEIVQPAAALPAPTEAIAQVTPTAGRAPATPVPDRTSTPAASPPAPATETPIPTSELRRLTEGACCVQPFFSPDSRQVLYIDSPNPDTPAGVYGVDLAAPQATPQLVNEIVGFRSPDRTVVATIDGQLVRFLDEVSGQRWTVDTGGNWPRFSPNGSQIIWSATDREGPYDRRKSEIWLADVDGSNARLLLTLSGGGFAGWLPDSQHILLLSRDDPAEEEVTLASYDIANERQTNLVREKRLRGVEISPGGTWIAYFLTFAEEPDKNGIWVVSSDGIDRFRLDVPGFGSYRWRDDETLLYVPLRTSPQESMQILAVDVATNTAGFLTDPTSVSFSISNGDWETSPDGRHVVFVDSADQNIWLITLP